MSGIKLNTTTYETDYFSGSQIGVYFGDILVDDIATIEYTVTQTKQPIYGYASQYWHTIADGQVMIQGVFTIPFKESGYLPVTLGAYSARMQNAIPIEQKGRQHLVHRENIERMMRNSHKNKYELYNELQAMDDQTFEDRAETFEDYLWHTGTATINYDTGNLRHSDLPQSGWENTVDTHRRPDQYPQFDIWILYGDIHTQAANHTIHKLLGCSIVREAQTITIGGEPILEQYSFIARNRT